MRLAIITVIYLNNILKNRNLLDFYRKLTICYKFYAKKKYILLDDIRFTIVSKKLETVLSKVVQYLLKGRTIKPVFCKFN